MYTKWIQILVLYCGRLIEGKFDFINGWVFYFLLKKNINIGFQKLYLFKIFSFYYIFVELNGYKAKYLFVTRILGRESILWLT